MDVKRNIDQAAHDITNVAGGQNEQVDEDEFIQRIETTRASWADFCAYFGQRKNFKILFGTSISWFAVDVSGLRWCHFFPLG